MSSSQRPSATDTFLATPHDALLLLEAARRRLIPRTTRRLTRSERDALVQDGAVFVWEERETQMQRWTDGKRWSCSRVMGEYLCYEQVLPGEVLPGTRTNTHSSRLDGGLVKQTFSTTLAEPADSTPKKYHVVSYHRHHTVDGLQRPSSSPLFADMNLDLTRWRQSGGFSRLPSPATSSSSSAPAARQHRPSTYESTDRGSSSSSWGLPTWTTPAVHVVGPVRRVSVASDSSAGGRRPSLDLGRRVPFAYAASSSADGHAGLYQPGQGLYPSLPLASSQHAPLDRRIRGEYADQHAVVPRYHPYRPAYSSAPPTASGVPSATARRMISPTPSLVSDSTNDSSRCSSPKTVSTSSTPSSSLFAHGSASSFPVVGTTSARASGSRLWPPPRPSPVARDTYALPSSVPVADLILPHPSLPAPAKTAADRPLPDGFRSVTWKPTTAPPRANEQPGYRSTLATEDERMLNRLSFRI